MPSGIAEGANIWHQSRVHLANAASTKPSQQAFWHKRPYTFTLQLNPTIEVQSR
jgi:hypothetical protein